MGILGLIVYDEFKMANEHGGELDENIIGLLQMSMTCLLYTSPSPRDGLLSRMPSSA